MEKPILLIGAGSQGRVTLDVLFDQKREVEGFLDDNPSLHGILINTKKVIGTIDNLKHYLTSHQMILTIGNNWTRFQLANKLNLPDSAYTNAIHSSNITLSSAKIGHGNMIFTQTIIGSNATVGNHVILNNGCIIEHDCIIKDFAALGPGCCMGGKVMINEGAFLSTGVTIAPRIKIGKRSIVGAGAVVVDDLPDDVLAYGVPARVIKKITPDEMWDRLL
ncbi:NeuD/PglB/VioB family sugar acetyltransferase [bacterium]|nr:NeuD/PglB/VioB family sugar acetyltransferase [bacterium]